MPTADHLYLVAEALLQDIKSFVLVEIPVDEEGVWSHCFLFIKCDETSHEKTFLTYGDD